MSKRLINKLKTANMVFLNSTPSKIISTVNEGDHIEVILPDEKDNENIIPENIEIEILFEDEFLLVVNKSPGIVVHPTSAHPSGTLANAVIKHFQSNSLKTKIRLVNRLDKDTSGIVIFAKNPHMHKLMSIDTNLTKEYLGIVHGVPEPQKGTIDLPIQRKPGSIMSRETSSSGAHSVTHYEVLEALHESSYMKFKLETGRTHQIRVHCQAMGHPLWNDSLYGNPLLEESIETKLPNYGQALHAHHVYFCHPISNKIIDVYCNPPEAFKNLLELLRKK